MTPEQLSLEFKNKTGIQQEEHSKKLIGSEIMVTGEILGIYKDYVSLSHAVPELPYDMQLSLHYEGERLYKQLLEYSSGDIVKISATLQCVRFGEYDYYDCNIISIVRIDTLEERRKRAREEAERKKENESGCFIATACYGNYDAPEVLILRNFRDKVLLNSKVGRIAVRFYYFTSPPIAKLLDKSERMKIFVRKNILAPIICKISPQ